MASNPSTLHEVYDRTTRGQLRFSEFAEAVRAVVRERGDEAEHAPVVLGDHATVEALRGILDLLGITSRPGHVWDDITAAITARSTTLDKSVELLGHYAKLLNIHDGGERVIPDSVEEWVSRVSGGAVNEIGREAQARGAVDESGYDIVVDGDVVRYDEPRQAIAQEQRSASQARVVSKDAIEALAKRLIDNAIEGPSFILKEVRELLDSAGVAIERSDDQDTFRCAQCNTRCDNDRRSLRIDDEHVCVRCAGQLAEEEERDDRRLTRIIGGGLTATEEARAEDRGDAAAAAAEEETLRVSKAEWLGTLLFSAEAIRELVDSVEMPTGFGWGPGESCWHAWKRCKREIRAAIDAKVEEALSGGEGAPEPGSGNTGAAEPQLDGDADVAVAGERMTISGAEFVWRAKVLLADENRQLAPDNARVDFYCEAIRLWREHKAVALRPITPPPQPGDSDVPDTIGHRIAAECCELRQSKPHPITGESGPGVFFDTEKAEAMVADELRRLVESVEAPRSAFEDEAAWGVGFKDCKRAILAALDAKDGA